jgi:RES domain-containing protein
MAKGHKEHETSEQLEHIHKLLHRIMTAIDNLSASVAAQTTAITNLATATNAAIADIAAPGATDAQIATLQSVVDNNTAQVNAQTAALNAAVAAVTPPVVVPPAVVPPVA